MVGGLDHFTSQPSYILHSAIICMFQNTPIGKEGEGDTEWHVVHTQRYRVSLCHWMLGRGGGEGGIVR